MNIILKSIQIDISSLVENTSKDTIITLPCNEGIDNFEESISYIWKNYYTYMRKIIIQPDWLEEKYNEYWQYISFNNHRYRHSNSLNLKISAQFYDKIYLISESNNKEEIFTIHEQLLNCKLNDMYDKILHGRIYHMESYTNVKIDLIIYENIDNCIFSLTFLD